jgi:hypothetical protein
MYDGLADKRERPLGMQLISVDKSLPETYTVGNGFAAMFHCGPELSLADARARFGK